MRLAGGCTVPSVAALFVDPAGVYAELPGVDLWPESRDARLYAGTDPVVAHPPCQLWTNFAALNYQRWGGEHNRPGNDGGCFSSALANVLRCGGVLEHPAYSKAWRAYRLCPPVFGEWVRAIPGGADSDYFVTEVWQSAYGHRCAKRTWLLYSGGRPPTAMLWERKPGTHQIGRFDVRKPVLSGRAASATPRAFAEVLVALARGLYDA